MFTFFKRWSGTPKTITNPSDFCAVYQSDNCILTRINDPALVSLFVDLRSIPAPRIYDGAIASPKNVGGAIATLISLPTPGTPGSKPTVKSFYWSDTETESDDGSDVLTPYIQPTGFSYESPAPGRWMSANSPSSSSSNVIVVNTLSALRSVPSSSNNRLAIMLGNSTLNDGQGGQYFWKSPGNDADAPLLVVRPNDWTAPAGGSGVWIQEQ